MLFSIKASTSTKMMILYAGAIAMSGCKSISMFSGYNIHKLPLLIKIRNMELQ